MAYRLPSYLMLAGLLALQTPNPALADASVDGFYRSDYVNSGVFDANPGASSSSQAFAATLTPTVEEAPLLLPYLREPKVYEGRFTKSTRGVEASEVADGDETAKGTVLVPLRAR